VADVDIVKWPRTSHLPWSPGVGPDDVRLPSLLDLALAPDLVVTEKLDGEGTTMTRDFVHARSGDSQDHPSRHAVKALWGEIGWRIPYGWYLVGENVAAVHSIYYPSVRAPYFYLFAVHDGHEVFSWDETLIVARMLDLLLVPTITRVANGLPEDFRSTPPQVSNYGDVIEGFVVRSAGRIPLKDWGRLAAKFVRAGHVQTDEHWLTQPVRWNGHR
jgi:hypothetical protein